MFLDRARFASWEPADTGPGLFLLRRQRALQPLHNPPQPLPGEWGPSSHSEGAWMQ